ncbi:hypothetical protein GJ496_012032 [Pomphorhynchus laevis]|nr:hypothetical protein GJ496_012032 [Pomphorhynchus laevis]
MLKLKMIAALAYGINLFANIGLLIMTIMALINLSDLECGLVGVNDCCRKLNSYGLPEIIVHLIGSAALLMANRWIFLILSLMLDALLLYRHMVKPRGHLSRYDPSEILKGYQLKQHIQITVGKMSIFLLFTFSYLFAFLFVLIE